MGGLGANIGSDEWEKAKKKAEASQDYAKSLRQGQTLSVAGTSGNSSQFKRRDPNQQKDKTARERALEFAKSIPKPKAAKVDGQNYRLSDSGATDDVSNSMFMNGIIEEEPFDEYGNTLKGSEMNDLNGRHEYLANEVDKLKRLFN